MLLCKLSIYGEFCDFLPQFSRYFFTFSLRKISSKPHIDFRHFLSFFGEHRRKETIYHITHLQIVGDDFTKFIYKWTNYILSFLACS